MQKLNVAFIYFQQAYSLFEQERYTESLNDIKISIENNPNNKEAYIVQGLIFEELKKDKKALESYNEGLKFQPNDKEILLLKSLLLQKMGKYYDAS